MSHDKDALLKSSEGTTRNAGGERHLDPRAALHIAERLTTIGRSCGCRRSVSQGRFPSEIVVLM